MNIRPLVPGALALSLICVTAISVGPSSGAEDEKVETDTSDAPTDRGKESGLKEESSRGNEESREIPLEQIWAHMMPGTRNIAELEKDIPDEKRLLVRIARALRNRYKQIVEPAFAVEGSDFEALRNASYIILRQKPRPQPIRAGRAVSIVFFTHYSHYYVHLTEIEIQERTVRIEYELVPHATENLTFHFALIPIGELPKGTYDVEIVAQPMAKEFLDEGFKEVDEQRKSLIASGAFKFEVI